MALIFSTDIYKIQIQNFIKICQVGAQLFHVDGRKEGPTDRLRDGRDEVTFRNLANATQKGATFPQYIINGLFFNSSVGMYLLRGTN
jgi:hypothetical protein